MGERRRWWVKLEGDFYQDKKIKALINQCGSTAVIIYQKMMLKSLDTECCLRYENLAPTFDEEIAEDIDENSSEVSKTLTFLIRHKMILAINPELYELPQAAKLSGSEGASAGRMRNQRERKAKEASQSDEEASQCDEEASQCSVAIDIDRDRKELEQKIKQEREPEPKGEGSPEIPTVEMVKSECEEKHYNVDPVRFIDVNQSRGWMSGNTPIRDWKALLKSWNDNEQKKNHSEKPKNRFNNFQQRDYSNDDLERLLLQKPDEAKRIFRERDCEDDPQFYHNPPLYEIN